MEHPEMNYKLLVMAHEGSYFMYFHSLDKAEAFAFTQLRKSVKWTIRRVGSNKLIDYGF